RIAPLRVVRFVARELVLVLVVRPGGVLLFFIFSGMALTQVGPVAVTESAFQEVASLVELGVAADGYLNVRVCANESAATEDTLPVPLPICTEWVVEPVLINDIARNIGNFIIVSYFFALMIGNIVVLIPSDAATPQPKQTSRA